LKEIKNLIKHLNKYQLNTHKRADFMLLNMAVAIMERGEHFTIEGIKKLVNIKASMNLGLSDQLKEAFPTYEPVPRPTVVLPKRFHPDWTAGFVTADGSFVIRIAKASTSLGETVRLVFAVTQHSRDLELMEKLQYAFGKSKVGGTSKSQNRNICDFSVRSLAELSKVVSLFKNHPPKGIKQLNFEGFCKVFELVKDKAHLTSEGLDKIKEIRSEMNSKRIHPIFEKPTLELAGSFYIYNSLKTKLLFETNEVKVITEVLRLSESTLKNLLNTSTAFYGRWILSQTLEPQVRHEKISLSELKNKIDKRRSQGGKK
jgi:hypothetical protein